MATPTTSPQSTEDRGPDPPPARRRPARAPGLPVSVGGTTASFVDQGDVTQDRLPLFIGGVVILSIMLLTVTFRSRHGGAQGRRHEPAVDRRGLRRRGLPRRGRLGRAAGRDRHADAGAAVHPRDHVRDPVRALDGLRGVPAQPRPRGVPARPQHGERGDRGAGADRARHHRGGADHGRRVRGLRPRARRSSSSSSASAWPRRS